jgi:hypothetical protein
VLYSVRVEVINHTGIGQKSEKSEKYKRLDLGGGHAYDRSSD